MNARTTPSFHPDQFILADYAAGSLHGAVALPLAVHLEYCDQCRAETHQRQERTKQAAWFEVKGRRQRHHPAEGSAKANAMVRRILPSPQTPQLDSTGTRRQG
jgi:anti-sigma factor ChrR (cupin superfamily)